MQILRWGWVLVSVWVVVREGRLQIPKDLAMAVAVNSWMDFGLIALLGVAFGSMVAACIFLSDLLASRFGANHLLLSLILRIGFFGISVISTAEIVGYFFGSYIRQHILLFWFSFALGFIALPIIFSWWQKRNQ